jgi:hypothetical protein
MRERATLSRMRHRKSVVDLKIERANQHREELLAHIKAFRERQPYSIREERKESGGILYRVVTAHNSEDPPDSIPLLLGDFIQNLRASLDYLIGAMRVDGPSRDSAFPICTRRSGVNGFLQLSKKKLAGIPTPAKKRIERMQPYDRRYGRPRPERIHWEALAILQTFWNIEKHRTVLLAGGFLAPDYVAHNRTGKQSSGIGHRTTPSGDEADWWLPIDSRDQTFDPHFGIEVALTKPWGFADDWPDIVGWSLDGLVEYMYRTVYWEVLPQLREFIQPGA